MRQLYGFLLLLPVFLPAQVKFDATWLVGNNLGPQSEGYGGTKIDFNQPIPSVEYIQLPFAFDGITIMNDSLGKPLFYSNGCEIINQKHEIMENGDEINIGGFEYGQTCAKTRGYGVNQGMLTLPWPGRPNQYAMLHLHRPDIPGPWYNRNLLLTTIDISRDSGFGAVTKKNQLVFQDTFCDMLTAVRHANGRDWWVVLPRYNKGRYYIFLLSPQGLSEPMVRDIGVPIDEYLWGVQAGFSPNGKKYVNMSYSGGLQVFDFDRCSGNMESVFHCEDLDFSASGGLYGAACGVAFSISSRFLYVGTGYNLTQFDMRADDILSSKVHIGQYDGFGYFHSKDISPLATAFYQMMLAPNGKIYMSTPNGTKYLHIIHKPDSLGLACDFEQRGLNLFGYHGFGVPNFPHFRLYDLPGSPCDTLGINGPQPPEDTLPPPPVCGTYLSLWPNPVSSVASVELPDCQGGLLSIFDSAGRLISEQRIAPGEGAHPIVVSEYVPGIYFVRFWPDKEGEVVVRGLSVVR